MAPLCRHLPRSAEFLTLNPIKWKWPKTLLRGAGVLWQCEAQVLPIRPLLETLEFTKAQSSWGMVFRYGLFQITRGDFSRIARAMPPTKLHSDHVQPHIG